MIPPKRNTDFEKVVVGEFIAGKIVGIEYDPEHKSTYQGKERIYYAIRLVFDLEGYKFPHRTRWMTFSYSEKANLFKKYLLKLVEGIVPDCDFDLDKLKNMPVQTYWEEENNFQSVALIKPANGKLKHVVPTEPQPVDDFDPSNDTNEEVPF